MIRTLAASAAIGLALALLARASRRLSAGSTRPAWRRAGLGAAIVLGVACVPFSGLAAYLAGCLALGQPGPEDRMLREGVRYRREVRGGPRPTVAHLVEVDLRRGIRIVASAQDVDTRSAAIPATLALMRLGADVVVNANFFHPFRETHPLDYSPRPGELVQVLGPAIGRGGSFGLDGGDWVTFWSEPGGRVGFGAPPGEADAAVSGIGWLVRRGANVVADPEKPYPRTALGLNKARDRLLIAVVDGKQPRYSLGMDLRETADLLIRLGAEDAIQLDGGGSSTLAARDDEGWVDPPQPPLPHQDPRPPTPGRQLPRPGLPPLRPELIERMGEGDG